MDSYISFDLSVLAKKWKIIAIFAVVALLLAYCYTAFVSKPTYWCSRTYYINNSVSYSNDNESRSATINDMNVSRLLVETYKETLGLDNMLSCLSTYIKDTHNLDISYRSLASCISVNNAGTTEIMEITVRTGDLRLSRVISDSIDAYLIPLASDSIGAAEVTSLGVMLEDEANASPIKSAIIGAVFGLIIGVAFAVVMSLINNKVTDEDEFTKKFKIPVLGNIPDPSVITSKGGYKYGN